MPPLMNDLVIRGVLCGKRALRVHLDAKERAATPVVSRSIHGWEADAGYLVLHAEVKRVIIGQRAALRDERDHVVRVGEELVELLRSALKVEATVAARNPRIPKVRDPDVDNAPRVLHVGTQAHDRRGGRKVRGPDAEGQLPLLDGAGHQHLAPHQTSVVEPPGLPPKNTGQLGVWVHLFVDADDRPATVLVAVRFHVSMLSLAASGSHRRNCRVGKSPTICALIEKFPE